MSKGDVLLYLAGPYTHPDPVENTHRVIRVADALMRETDYLPFIPHLNLLWHTIIPHEPRFWYDVDLRYLYFCDAIVRLPGDSVGADEEMAFAQGRGLTIVEFESLPESVQKEWLQ